MEIYP